jgi:hypothetical protein
MDPLFILHSKGQKMPVKPLSTFSELLSQYGYASSGESFSIGDANEAWILELIGKGPGKKELYGLPAGSLMVIFPVMQITQE